LRALQNWTVHPKAGRLAALLTVKHFLRINYHKTEKKKLSEKQIFVRHNEF
jgi:hypothetical protein